MINHRISLSGFISWAVLHAVFSIRKTVPSILFKWTVRINMRAKRNQCITKDETDPFVFDEKQGEIDNNTVMDFDG